MKQKLLFFFLSFLFALSSVSAAGIADLHKDRNVPCSACHGKDVKNLQEPTINTCTTCHPLKALTQKTKGYKPTNPHDSPHYHEELECSNCHHGHIASEDYCQQCHTFNFKVK